MTLPIQVSASILAADFCRLAEEIKKAEEAGCDRVHCDVMDGHFVPNITIGPVIVEAIRPLTKLPIEAHLMIENPHLFIDSFIAAGADMIAVHAECYGPASPALLAERSAGGSRRMSCHSDGEFPKEVDAIDTEFAQKDIRKIKKQNKKVFITINPGTPLCITPLLNDLDGVLIMSVNPGFAGQKFLPEVLSKIKALRTIFKGNIEIDGGINDSTAPAAVVAGANILVTASYFFKATQPREAIQKLKNLEFPHC